MERRTTNRAIAGQALLVCAVALLLQNVCAQSNYASHANNIGYRGEGLPEEATLDGKVSIHFFFCFQFCTFESVFRNKLRADARCTLFYYVLPRG